MNITRVIPWVAAAALLGSCGGGGTEQDLTQSEGPPAQLAQDEEALRAEGFVPTPAGWFHSSCVREVGEGALVDDSAEITAIVHRTGQRETLDPCLRVSILSGSAAAAPPPSITGGWVEDAWLETANGIQTLQADISVPGGPGRNVNQLVYLFPGLEVSRASPMRIFQPVLQWGASPAGGGASWGIASWSVTSSGNALHSPLQSVNAGDAIHESMVGSNCSGQTCSTWTISAVDNSRGVNSTLVVNNSSPLRLAQGGALEAYGIKACSDYPASPAAFTGIGLTRIGGAGVALGWHDEVLRGGCNMHVNSNGSQVVLKY